MTQTCFRGVHLRYVLMAGVPGLVLVCAGVPAFIILRMRQLQHDGKLTKAISVRTYGFLFYGFVPALTPTPQISARTPDILAAPLLLSPP